MENLIAPLAVVAGCGLLLGILLAVAAALLKTKADETLETVLDLLPGANCGGCGFAGCEDYARALVNDEATTTACTVGGRELVVALSVLLGANDPDVSRKVAFVHCSGKLGNTEKSLIYQGVPTCKSLSVIGFDGQCYFGCLGLGDCVAHCEFGAIQLRDGVASVDAGKCVGCGKCAFYCPKNLITLHWAKNMPAVACRNTDKGSIVRTACRVGCIGCKLCEKACKYSAVTVRGNLARVDYEKCTGCLECIKVCRLGLIKTYY